MIYVFLEFISKTKLGDQPSNFRKILKIVGIYIKNSVIISY